MEVVVRDALNKALFEEMERDGSVFIIGEEVAEYQGAYKVTQGLLQKFGARRVVDTPISEYGFSGVGVGSAFAGLRPVVEFMSFNFSMQAIDHVINSAAKTNYMSDGQVKCPIVFRGPNGAAAGVAAQHSQCYASWYSHVPGLKVVAPYFADDYKGLLKSAIRDPSPVIFLENEVAYGLSHEVEEEKFGENYLVEIGKARIVKKGNDVTLITFSLCVKHSIEAVKKLESEGISVELIDLRTLRPIDTDTIIASLKKTNRLVCVEEGWPFCGIGAEISAIVMEEAFDYLDAPVMRVTAKDVPLPYSKPLESLALPSTEDIIECVKRVCD